MILYAFLGGVFMRVIFHIDLNAFFANAEISRHPELANKPIVIAHDSKRSVCSTASYEARAYGIHSAMPVYEAKRKCKHLIIVEPHYDLYKKLSHQFFNILLSYSQKLEIASIDEGYIDMSDYIITHHIHPADLALEIQNKVLRQIHLPCSIGISPNKFLSKMASDMKKPLGIVMLTKSNIREKLWPLPVDEMFGIGKKTAPYLKEAGIQTIGDVANYDNYQTLRSILGRHALLYYYKANGKDDSKVIYEDYDLKSISNSTTFLNDINDLSSLEEEFRPLAMTVHQRAIKSRLLTNTIVITLKYSNFKSINRQMNIDHYTNSYEEIYSYAMMLLRKHYDYKPIRLIGLSINNLKKEGKINEQLSFFTEIKSDRESREVQVDDIIKQLNKNNNTHLMKASSLLKKTSS